MVKKTSSWSQVVSGRPTNLFVASRNLQLQDLGAVIFGCTNTTIAECHARQLFGLPRSHLSYVQNIKEGLPLFLFNYDDRRLHGIYEAAGNGKFCPESNAWTYNGNEKTNYPAQVAMRVRTWCVPLEESKFRDAIIGNYYQKMTSVYGQKTQKPHFFRFELDHAQTRALMVMFTPSSSPIKFWMPPVAQPGGEHVREPTPPPVWVQKVEGDNELKSEKVLVSYADMVKQNKFEIEGVGTGDVDVERNNQLKTEKSFVSYADMVKQNKFEIEGVGTGDVDVERNNQLKTEKSFVSYADMVKQNKFEIEGVGTGDVDVERNNQLKTEKSFVSYADMVKQNKFEIEGVGTGDVDVERNNQLKTEKSFVSYADMVKQNKFEVERVGMGDVDNGHASSSKESSNGFDDLDCKETPPEWEDHALFNKEVEVQQQQQSGQLDTELSFTLVLEKLKALSVQQLSSDSYANGAGTEVIDPYSCKDMQEITGAFLEGYSTLPENLDTEVDQLSWGHSCLLLQGLDYESCSEAKLIDVVKELSDRIEAMEKKQVKSNKEVKDLQGVNDRLMKRVVELKYTVKNLNSKIDPLSLDDSLNQFVEECLGSEDVIYLIGGFDGISFLPSLDSFSPSLDILTPLKQMTVGKSYTSTVALGGKIFVLGGGDGASWFDTVDCYDRTRDDWIPCPALTSEKGSLAGVSLYGKIYAFGGGDGIGCFSEVEVFDPAQGKWIKSQPMLEKRFALAGAELNGAIYAVGGFNGIQYLSSAERLDPREPNWKMLPAMSTGRGCHTVAVLDEKIYTIGGYDGDSGAMTATVEFYEPRMPSWVIVEPMNYTRGYHASAVLGGSIFTLGGVKGEADTILDVVERYKEGCGWVNTGMKSIGQRCYCSAIVF